MSLKENLKREIEKGLAGKNGSIPFPVAKLDNYIEIAKNTNYLFVGDTGSGKCFSKGTKVIMYNGELKAVEDIQVGDLLMGIDGSSRTVLNLSNGIDQLYEVKQNRGITYKVNSNHVLALRTTGKRGLKKYGIFHNVSIKDYLNYNGYDKHILKGYRSPGLNFPEKTTEICPYFLGLWLGDGDSEGVGITSVDKEIIDYIYKYANLIGCNVNSHKLKYSLYTNTKVLRSNDITGEQVLYDGINDCVEKTGYSRNYILNDLIPGKFKQKGYSWKYIDRNNQFREFLKDNNLFGNKHIPNHYLYNSRENRLLLLAGLIDSDGHLTKNAGYEIVSKNKILSENITFLSRSLGFYTSVKEKIATMKRKDGSIYSCLVYRISIYGNIRDIPCKLSRKKCNKNTRNREYNCTGIKVTKAEVGEYYGFEVDGNHLFLLEDFTVTHNSTLAQDLILNILDWYFNNIHGKTNDLKLSIIYFGMERKQYMYSAKWVSRMIFLNEGLLIPVKKILGRKRKVDPATGKSTKEMDLMNDREIKLVNKYMDIFDLWEKDEVFTCIEGTHNATGIDKYLRAFAKRHGDLSELDKTDGNPLRKQTYSSHHENHIVLVATDYVGIVDSEKDSETGQKKQRLDKYSETMRKGRDVYGFSPINIQQLSRAVSGTDRLKLNDVRPKLSDIADTSDLARDADVVVAIFDAYRYLQEGATSDLLGYNLTKLRDAQGVKYYRSLHILKNSFDAEGINVGVAFYPFTGSIKAMPKSPKEMTDSDYQDITSGSYFLTP